MTELACQSAIEQVGAIKSGKISSSELLDHYLERIDRLNPDLNAIVSMDVKQAKARARAADEALARNETWGLLHGLPMTIKDTLEVAGMPCTAGAPPLKDHVPQKHAAVVQALVDAGAIVFGKTNVPLYAGDFQSFNDIYGQTNNPWDTRKTPGGSSGGAAAALAAGLSALEIGSDLGGSIRVPAHFCGLYGHKPSYGIVPQKGHVPPPPGIFTGEYSLAIDMMAAGPLARNIEDVELALEIIVGPEAPNQQAWTIKLPPPRRQRLADYKIGLWLDDPACPVDAGVGDTIQAAVDQLTQNGAAVSDVRPEVDFNGSYEAFLILNAAVMGAAVPEKMFKKWAEKAENLSPEDRSYLAHQIRGATQRHRNWIEQDGMRELLRQKWADYFKTYDVLICPPAVLPAFAHDHGYIFDRTLPVNAHDRPYMDIMGWSNLASVAKLPATVLPVGRTSGGLPVGMQVIGPYLEDRTPIHVARLITEIIGGFVPPPGF
ncbi:MAG: amidase [Desulfobacterales bacterium]